VILYDLCKPPVCYCLVFAVWTVTCKDVVAEPYRQASVTCKAEDIAGGVKVDVKWFRTEGHVIVEEDDNHRLEKDHHVAKLTIISVCEHFMILSSDK